MSKTPSIHNAYVEAASEIAKTTKKRVADLIGHGGEKGRVVEGLVVELIERFLPKRFSIGSGLIVTSSGKVSSQTDIVIYDNFHNAPIKMHHGLSIFPIESVYATIEVKSTLDDEGFQKSLKNNAKLRSFKAEKYYVKYDPVKVEGQRGKYTVGAKTLPIELAPRTYIVAFEAEWNTYDGLKERFRYLAEKQKTHLHGVLILDPDWFYWQKAHVATQIRGEESNGTRAFLLNLIRNIDSFPMIPAQMHHYLGPDPEG